MSYFCDFRKNFFSFLISIIWDKEIVQVWQFNTVYNDRYSKYFVRDYDIFDDTSIFNLDGQPSLTIGSQTGCLVGAFYYSYYLWNRCLHSVALSDFCISFFLLIFSFLIPPIANKKIFHLGLGKATKYCGSAGIQNASFTTEIFLKGLQPFWLLSRNVKQLILAQTFILHLDGQPSLQSLLK